MLYKAINQKSKHALLQLIKLFSQPSYSANELVLKKKSDSLVPELSRNDIFPVRDFNEQRIIGAGALQG